MPNIESSKKQLRTDAKRTVRNKSVRTECKTNITKAEKLIIAGDADKAKAAVLAAESTLDKAVIKGVLHPNNAARRKSRLAAKLNSIKS